MDHGIHIVVGANMGDSGGCGALSTPTFFAYSLGQVRELKSGVGSGLEEERS